VSDAAWPDAAQWRDVLAGSDRRDARLSSIECAVCSIGVLDGEVIVSVVGWPMEVDAPIAQVFPSPIPAGVVEEEIVRSAGDVEAAAETAAVVRGDVVVGGRNVGVQRGIEADSVRPAPGACSANGLIASECVVDECRACGRAACLDANPADRQ